MVNGTHTTYTLTESELVKLLKKAFHNGALSHSNYMGQSDTCWANVVLDMEEDVESLIKDLNETEKQNKILG